MTSALPRATCNLKVLGREPGLEDALRKKTGRRASTNHTGADVEVQRAIEHAMQTRERALENMREATKA